MQIVITKFCTGCNTEKELNTINFKPNKARSNGWETKCRECIKAYYREREKKPENQEKRRVKQQKYKEKHPEMIKAKSARYRKKLKERGLTDKDMRSEEGVAKKAEREKERSSNPSPKRAAWKRAEWERKKANGYNEVAKEQYKENPLPKRMKTMRRNKRMKGIKGSHTKEQIMEKYRYHGEVCYYCKQPLTILKMTIDHRIPVSRGGTDFIANIVPCCGSCNSSKRDKTDKEFISWRNKLAKGMC